MYDVYIMNLQERIVNSIDVLLFNKGEIKSQEAKDIIDLLTEYNQNGTQVIKAELIQTPAEIVFLSNSINTLTATNEQLEGRNYHLRQQFNNMTNDMDRMRAQLLKKEKLEDEISKIKREMLKLNPNARWCKERPWWWFL